MSQSAKCAKCGEDLPVSPLGLCPKCGSTERNYSAMQEEKVILSASMMAKSMRRTEYFETHP